MCIESSDHSCGVVDDREASLLMHQILAEIRKSNAPIWVAEELERRLDCRRCWPALRRSPTVPNHEILLRQSFSARLKKIWVHITEKRSFDTFDRWAWSKMHRSEWNVNKNAIVVASRKGIVHNLQECLTYYYLSAFTSFLMKIKRLIKFDFITRLNSILGFPRRKFIKILLKLLDRLFFLSLSCRSSIAHTIKKYCILTIEPSEICCPREKWLLREGSWHCEMEPVRARAGIGLLQFLYLWRQNSLRRR